jgi:AcrR family transcriptional regulator
LIASARDVFAEQGLEAPLDEIARRAGVANATLYRRFPTRHDLVMAVFTERLRAYADAARRAAQEPDPWSGLARFVSEIFRMQAESQGLADLVTTIPRAGRDELDKARDRAHDHARLLLARAQQAGALRADVTPEDLVLLLMANAGVTRRTGRDAPAAADRLAAIVLDGLRADRASAPAPPPLSRRRTLAAMRRPPHYRSATYGHTEEATSSTDQSALAHINANR